ncbi:MAG: hypothetical protein WC393_01035 [Candidatus Nanoarchaeia archaeon]|jgi:hypothetical protein
MAKKVFNKRIHRVRRKLQRRELKEISKANIQEKIKKSLNKSKEKKVSTE